MPVMAIMMRHISIFINTSNFEIQINDDISPLMNFVKVFFFLLQKNGTKHKMIGAKEYSSSIQ